MKPLLRSYEYTQGVEVHVASYPPAFEKPKNSPWLYSMTAEGSQTACQMMAIEGATFVLLATSVVSEANKEKAGYANAPYAKIVSCPLSYKAVAFLAIHASTTIWEPLLTTDVARGWLFPNLWSGWNTLGQSFRTC